MIKLTEFPIAQVREALSVRSGFIALRLTETLTCLMIGTLQKTAAAARTLLRERPTTDPILGEFVLDLSSGVADPA